MIALLKGTLIEKTPEVVIVDAGGVGYEVFIPLSTFYDLPAPGAPATLHIHTRLREDSLRLFGFFSLQEKQIFEVLIGINKVGPKLALAILSGLPFQELWAAVSSNDVARLSAIPGVGKKTAERLALELRDKLAAPVGQQGEAAPVSSNPMRDDALSALINLGYKKPDAEKALDRLNEKGTTDSIETLIRDSLNLLSSDKRK
ncbi:MAG: Holliday junction branch migration protein RuvA [Candidatus Nitronauta litoralis]|uniref:Holliday junction branch migration complex subunit RuvA n=1 Tax=Candidatus Nitronauta litoralis TaxID=2705533 RepID=A0A7T0FYD1_9BACT|nr:MAG: Holliday junction branch migration protein RuvA [Candidatus Nitronauta litoralis]